MTISSQEDLSGMTRVGRLVGKTLREMKAAVRPGMTTAELDGIGASYLRRRGARSAPQLTYGFPGFNLISVNEEIVHGVPERTHNRSLAAHYEHTVVLTRGEPLVLTAA